MTQPRNPASQGAAGARAKEPDVTGPTGDSAGGAATADPGAWPPADTEADADADAATPAPDGPAAAAGAAVSRRWPKILLRVGIGLALLAAVAWFVDIGSTFEILSGARPGPLLVALALFVLERVVAAVRWRMLISGLGPAPPLSRFVSLLFSATFVAYFLPGGLGGEVFRIWGLTRGAITVSRALASVFVERVLALVALGMLILWGLATAPFRAPVAVLDAVLISLAIIAVGTLMLFSKAMRRLVDRCLPGQRLARIRGALSRLYENFDLYLAKPGLLALGLVFAIAFQLLRVVLVWASAWALGMDVPVEILLFAVPIVNLITQLPISVGGLGVREASYAALLGLAGVTPEAAVALSLLTYALSVLSVTPGAVTLARGGIRG